MKPSPIHHRSGFTTFLSAALAAWGGYFLGEMTAGAALGLTLIAASAFVAAWKVRPSVSQPRAQNVLDAKEAIIQDLSRIMEGKR